jgi:uncharacterized protein YbaR (Trm112 family)
VIDSEFLSLLRCPLTLQPLRLAGDGVLARLPAGSEGALVREDGAVAYPIREGIPLLLPEEAIAVGKASSEQ